MVNCVCEGTGYTIGWRGTTYAIGTQIYHGKVTSSWGHPCSCGRPFQPERKERRPILDHGHRPVWTSKDDTVFLTWDEVGDSHLLSIRTYLDGHLVWKNAAYTLFKVDLEILKRGL